MASPQQKIVSLTQRQRNFLVFKQIYLWNSLFTVNLLYKMGDTPHIETFLHAGSRQN